MNAQQSHLLERLLDKYLSRMARGLAAGRKAKLEATDMGRVTFAWAGGLAVGEPHYYRIQGPSFHVEYDNMHVGRDFESDFGRDLVRALPERAAPALTGPPTRPRVSHPPLRPGALVSLSAPLA